jgi:hypothetical protein
MHQLCPSIRIHMCAHVIVTASPSESSYPSMDGSHRPRKRCACFGGAKATVTGSLQATSKRANPPRRRERTAAPPCRHVAARALPRYTVTCDRPPGAPLTVKESCRSPRSRSRRIGRTTASISPQSARPCPAKSSSGTWTRRGSRRRQTSKCWTRSSARST